MIDTHTHTISSLHAYSTLEENVISASMLGLSGIGVTDHYSSMVGHGDKYDKRDYQFLINLKIIPRIWHDIKVYRGAEVDIVNLNGDLYGYDQLQRDGSSMNEYMLGYTDYHIVSVHRVSKEMREASPVQVAEMYIAAISQNKSMIIGHINRAGLIFDEDMVLDEVKKIGKAIEINESTLTQSGQDKAIACRRIAEKCAEKGVFISIASDAHISTDIGRIDTARKMLNEIHFPEELIINRNVETFDKFLNNTAG
ncbi:MAG: PHP domain-containing protein [Eubacteriales bacterium]|nr:PHP domain-containing protein [Eubacteriales bacterium]